MAYLEEACQLGSCVATVVQVPTEPAFGGKRWHACSKLSWSRSRSAHESREWHWGMRRNMAMCEGARAGPGYGWMLALAA